MDGVIVVEPDDLPVKENAMNTTAKTLTAANVAALQKRLPKGTGTAAKAPTTYHY
jgi:hypothetical protein